MVSPGSAAYKEVKVAPGTVHQNEGNSRYKVGALHSTVAPLGVSNSNSV